MASHPRPRSVETVVVGAGQSGLIISSLLRQAGREHVLLDRRATLGGGWQDRWDAFQLVGPNWTVSLDGFPYRGTDPDGFMPRDEIIDHFRAYGAAIGAPVELDTEVTGLTSLEGGPRRFRLETTRGTIETHRVVVASGPFGRPFIPPVAAAFDPSILQLHSHDYRNPDSLPSGGVLLIGSGQTGVQLAEELMAAGRSVTLAVGHCGRVPRTYRGMDVFWWLRQLATRGREVGTSLPTVEELPSPAARFRCNPQLSGHGTPHDTNLRQMAAAGLRLVGRLEGADGARAQFAADLAANLEFADSFFDEQFRDRCDTFALRQDLSLPDDEPAQYAFTPPTIRQLDLVAEGIATVLWTSGYRAKLDWITLPVIDDVGLPIQTGGLTRIPGLSFIGTPWLVDMASANLVGLERDATALASRW